MVTFRRLPVWLYLVVILCLAGLLRLVNLGQVPLGVTHDELGYIYNAYALSKTGANVFSERFPLFTWMFKGGFPFLPVPIYLSSIFFFFLPLSAFAGRLPSALLGVGDVLLLFILIRKLFGSSQLAIVSALFLAISPWHLHFSRSAYDPNFSLFFYLLGTVCYLLEAEKKRLPLASTFLFLLAVFSYRGMNVIYLPLVLLLFWYSFKKYHMDRKEIIFRLVGIVLVVVSFFIVVSIYGQSYTSEALFFNDPKIQESVDTQIREAKGPLFVRRLFVNKPTFLISKLRDNYLGSYSPDFLFLHTESSAIYSIWSRGRVYFLDLLFIPFGIFALYKRRRGAAIFILGAVMIGGLPGLIGGSPYSARNLFIALFLPVLTAAGVIALVTLKKSNVYRLSVIIVLLLSYGYSFSGYLFDYYDRYAYQSAEAWAKSLKDASFLITDKKGSYTKVIFGNTSFGDVVQYAFYARIPVQNVQNAWLHRKESVAGKSIFVLDNISFQNECVQISKKQVIGSRNNHALLVLEHPDCDKYAVPEMRIKDYYGNTVWSIYSL